MSDESRIEVAIVEQSVYIKPCGFATQDNSLGIPDFLDGMFRAGCLFVVFDLQDCKGMDSTFLGVIADAATAGRHRGEAKTAVIVNADEANVRQLRRVGLLSLVKLHEGHVDQPEKLELSQVDFIHLPGTEHQRLERIRDLHEQLAKLNEKNRRTFGPFLTMVEEELRRHRKQEQRRE